jgi:hypothetical protein
MACVIPPLSAMAFGMKMSEKHKSTCAMKVKKW